MNKPKKRNENHGVKIVYPVGILDTMIGCLVNVGNNSLIDSRLYQKIRELISISDMTDLAGDSHTNNRLLAIDYLLDLRLNRGINNPDDLDAFLQSAGVIPVDIADSLMDSIWQPDAISAQTVSNLDRWISDRITYANLYDYIPRIAELDTHLKAGTRSIEEIVHTVTDEISGLDKSIRLARSVVDSTNNDFNSTPTQVENALSKTISMMGDNYGISTGIYALNRVLNGKFYNSKFYVFLAAPKRGKSTLLLNLALQSKEFSGKVKTKDATKKPAVLYLTMENAIYETVERIWSYYFSDEPMPEKINDAMRMLQETSFINKDTEVDKPAIFIKYRKGSTVSANTLKDIVADMNEEGYECVGMFLDYLKRMNPIERAADERLRLGNISNDLQELAKELVIPIISAMQMTKEAIKILTDNSSNALDSLGSQHIGESHLIVENVDGLYIIDRTKLSSGEEYMMFKLTSPRYSVPEDAKWGFYQPFENGMQIKTDVDLSHTEIRNRQERIEVGWNESIAKEKLSDGSGSNANNPVGVFPGAFPNVQPAQKPPLQPQTSDSIKRVSSSNLGMGDDESLDPSSLFD